MVLKRFETKALAELSSKKQQELLDAIDGLRCQGISHYVSLPQIIVCGDQSSGKSSVLEAISGVAFPVKSNLCTRFPIELVLRRSPHSGIKVSVILHQTRNRSDETTLEGFQAKLDGFDGLQELIESAQTAMSISASGKAFCSDILRVEVSGPDRPHLTIVDLPGLIHSETKHQSASDINMIQSIVQNYMKEPRSIILAVVSAKNDYANQIVLRLAQTADETGKRTLGVITKPDTLIRNSPSEQIYVSLAKNEDVEFRLGWHILKNLDSEKGTRSLTERDKEERDFFRDSTWSCLPGSSLGIESLRERLSEVLLYQIGSELPGLLREIKDKSSACYNELNRLGEPRTSVYEQRHFLVQLSQKFQALTRIAVDGSYNDSFFDDANTESGYQKRLRAVVQSLNITFAEDITLRGHRRQIVDSPDQTPPAAGVTATTRTAFLDDIEALMTRTKGRELPGTFNPMIVADLFLQQSAPWSLFAQVHIRNVWKATKETIQLILGHITDAATSKSLFRLIFGPALNQLLDCMKTKTAEILTPHRSGHPITYNDSYLEALENFRNEREEKEYTETVENFLGTSDLASVYSNGTRDYRQLVAVLVRKDGLNGRCHVASDALDALQAYYQVALKRFIDDIAVEVIEMKLLYKLQDLLSPLAVISMSAELLNSIAGESEESRARRGKLESQLKVLTKGLETCKQFSQVNIAADFEPADYCNSEASEAEDFEPSITTGIESLGIGSHSDEVILPETTPIIELELEPVSEPEPASEPAPVPESETEITSHMKKAKKKSKKRVYE